MASSKKRTATRELNHDNWNDDEEKEERGVFEQARSDVLQSRVIKKAKRRGVTSSASSESGSGGTFAGFSGFKSTPIASAESKPSFDFLKTSVGVGGNGLNGNKNHKDESVTQASLADMFKPKPGSWKCNVCDISNESTVNKCAACTTPKPGGSETTETTKPATKWTCDTCMVPNAPEHDECVCCQAKKPGSNGKNVSSGFSFGKVSSPSIEGSTFKLGSSSNNGSSFKLDSNASGSGFTFGTSDVTKNDGSGFTFGASSNKETSSPSGFKFGGATKESGFKFGSSNATKESTITPEGSGFKFGSSNEAKESTSTPGGTGFKFGSSNETKKSTTISGESGFKFGSSNAKRDSTTSGGSGINFGSSEKEGSCSEGFKFGSPALNKEASVGSSTANMSTPTAPSNSTGFKFSSSQGTECGSLPKSTPSFKFGSESSKNTIVTPANNEETSSFMSKSNYRDKYAANLRALNRQLAKWVKSKVDENPNVILSPIFNDYEKHLNDIAEKYPLETSSTPQSMKEPTPLLGAVFGNKESKSDKVSFSTGSSGNTGFGSFSKPSTDDVVSTSSQENKEKKGDELKDKVETPKSEAVSSNLFVFGSTVSANSGFSFGNTAKSTPSSSSSPSGFSFGNKSTPVFGSGSSSSFFSGAVTSVQSTQNTENADDAAEDEPPKVEVKTVEESDAKFSMRCKLYYKKEKDFVDRGLGMVHIKLLDDNKKVQFLVRAETNLGNILLNIMLNDKINFTQRGNNLQFVAVPNPPIKGIPEGPVSMLVKVKNASMAEELHGKIQEILKEVSSSS